MADTIISKMISDSGIGLVFPEDPHCPGWDQNFNEGYKLINRLKIKAERMLLISNRHNVLGKEKSLRPLYDLNFRWEDFPNQYKMTALYYMQ